MDYFPENFNLPKLTPEEKEILTSSLTTKGIEAAVKTLPTQTRNQNDKKWQEVEFSS